MRDIAHDNINHFVGLCTEKPNLNFVESYCHRGSIQDVLAKDDTKLIDEFQFSFAMDIASVRDLLVSLVFFKMLLLLQFFFFVPLYTFKFM